MLRYIRNFIFVGSYWHLWYLQSLVLDFLILYIWIRLGYKTKTLAIIGSILYLLGLSAQGYYGFSIKLLNINWIANIVEIISLFMPTTRNFLCFGLLCVTLGYMAGEGHKINWKAKKLAFFFFIFMSLYALEVIILHHYNICQKGKDMFLMTVPSAYLFFLFTLTYKCEAGKGDFSFLRPYSNLIYYAHVGAMAFLTIIFPPFVDFNSLLRYMLIVLTCLVGSFTLFRIERIKRLRWLVYLHK